MRIVRYAVAVLCFLALTATNSRAFEFDIHVDITRRALATVFNLLMTLNPALKQEMVATTGFELTGFTPEAIEEITNANKSVDTDDCGNKKDWTVPAEPCTELLFFESLAAFKFLADEPPEEHFDAEFIQASSDLVFDAKSSIVGFLRQGNYVGARKVLGRALHAIQDFYSHTNYVELNYRSPQIERRIGFVKGSFRAGTPRLAGANEPTCLEGEYLFNNDLKTKLQTLLAEAQRSAGSNPLPIVRVNSRVKADRIEAAIKALDDAMKDPALTSGHFVLDLPNRGDPTEISTTGKCRHGWQKLGADQAGINKDSPGRPYYNEARALAIEHTSRFVVDLLTALKTDPQLGRDKKYVFAIGGLLGHDGGSVITSFKLGIPGAPNGASWDENDIIRGLFALNIKAIQPDILICIQSAKVQYRCLPQCDDANWSNDLSAYVCEQPVPPGRVVLADTNLRVAVREVGFGQAQRTIAVFNVEDPKKCNPFCTLELEPNRSVWIQFALEPSLTWTPGGGGTVPEPNMLPPAARLPIAKPGSAGGPGAPSGPGTPPGSGPSNAPANPGSRLAPASRAAPRSPEGIDASLRLRDADSCVGADTFYPAASGQNPQLYQMAAFSMAISDQAVKQSVLNAIRAKVGDDAFFTVMTGVIGDPRQSQALLGAYQNTAKNVVQQITSNGLTSLMRTPKPVSALLPDVDRWILSKLSSPALVSSAVDMMSGASSLTAECTLNELAKQGFTATVAGP